ncbi:MAG: hypothetical protein JNK64_13355 [Myxococcales bacterium]|nr:hypothetical protein [Myxococcales bacterium]
MRPWQIATAVVASACGFTPAGDTGDDSQDAAVGDGAEPDGATLDSAGPDARAIDAAPIDAPACPATYTVSSGGGRYSFRLGPASIATAGADCDDDLTGRTHLATFENGDLEAVLTAVGASSVTTAYVGGRCDDALDCDAKSNWFWQGSQAAIPSNLWSSGEPSGDLPFAFVEDRNGWGLLSSGGTIARAYLCECEP